MLVVMLLKELREAVLEANLELVRRGLVLYTFGNASGVDRERGLMVIKPSGVEYGELRPGDMVVTDLDGRVVDGALKPSSDLETHTLLYREFTEIGGVVHTHSEYATSFAQAGMAIPALGTTHADYFYGPVPCTAPLSDDAIGGRYVHETGMAIVARFKTGASDAAGAVAALDPMAVPACLVAGHAPFVWGKDVHDAAHNAVVLEAVARMAYRTLTLKAEADVVTQALLDRHYFRKHGAGKTYGQG
jgi:L-ribulose-5-phosphate 4-epimerase